MNRPLGGLRRRIAPAAAAGVILALALAACSGPQEATVDDRSSEYGFNETGLPIVDKALTLTIAGEKASLAPDYNEMSLVQQWEEDTNIAIEWNMLAPDVYAEKRNLLLASNDLPDAFFNSKFTDDELVRYGTDGTLIPLEGLIEKYAPNVQAIFEARPELKAAVTASDGHIYALPNAEELGLAAVPFFWSINTQWLDALGLDMPTTVEEYHDALVAFKTQDPNGNGKADEIPLSFINNWWCADIGDLFAALGGIADNADHRIVRDDEVIYTGADERYRDAIATLHDWYEEGLIDPESFTQDDKTYLAKGKTETPVLGSYVWWETEEVVGADRADQYALLPVLDGVDGQLVGRSNYADFGRSAFAITSANEVPAATMRWVDELYEPVMAAQVSFGPIGETLVENEDGVLEQAKLPDGVNAGELRQEVAPGAGAPHVLTREHFETVVLPEPRALQRLQDLEEHYLPYAEPQNYPSVFFSVDELQEIGSLEPDIKALVEQKRAQWITSGGIEDEWDAYVSQLETMGLDRLLEIWQTAYDRFSDAS
ncbi:ABC transporter substrate-binding protein [Agromyces aurantiacus]|uniref:ABC transporter substrate-binding protein n=1 Tax=Agromyces aurantiacus TaxID=165814 RepID=A0ABV9R172_9MICO|nr:ABC transporter substrate-binding protein [Agromyces aurantiacus]MBM7505892.1 putative aldouronate transport system substrate-binding protein [Agromyces aurantiacus]